MPADPKPPEPEPERDESLEALSKEAVREIEKRRDGSGGYAGEGDIG